MQFRGQHAVNGDESDAESALSRRIFDGSPKRRSGMTQLRRLSSCTARQALLISPASINHRRRRALVEIVVALINRTSTGVAAKI
jgi:hypothetical protein